VKCLSDLPAGPLKLRVAPDRVDIAAYDAAPLTFASLDPAEFPLFPAAPAKVTRYTVRSDDAPSRSYVALWTAMGQKPRFAMRKNWETTRLRPR
jgi:hypothetical protein